MLNFKNKRTWYKLFNSDCWNRTVKYPVSVFLNAFDLLPVKSIYCLRNILKSGAKFVCSNKYFIRHMIDDDREITDSNYIVAVKAPDEHIIVQGHYDGLQAEVSTKKDALRFIQDDFKLISRMGLMNLVGYHNYKKLDNLVHDYSDSIFLKDRPVIEFSLYSKPVGIHKEKLIQFGKDWAGIGSALPFIKAVTPEFVIFSAGHEYGHPRKATANRFLDAGVNTIFSGQT